MCPGSTSRESTPPQSPESLGPRTELKHLLAPERMEPLVRELQSRLPADPHARDAEWPQIQVESLYFDDSRRVGYRGRSRRQLPKHRLRRYDFTESPEAPEAPEAPEGAECDSYLEEKLRVGDQVWKRRLRLTHASDIEGIVAGRTVLHGEREWFRRRFRVLDLRPTLWVRYSRLAFQSSCGVRVTLDREVEASRLEAGVFDGRDRREGHHSDDYCSDAHESHSHRGDGSWGGVDVWHGVDVWRRARGESFAITGEVIVELKGPSQASPLFEELRRLLDIPSCPYSKYSHGLEAVGLEVANPVADDPNTT